MIRFRSLLIRSLLWAACAFALPTLPRRAGAQEVLDGIAAVVNTDVITFSQVREIVAPSENSARQNLKGEAQVEEIKKIRLAALNKLIDRQVILQEFAKMKKEHGAQIPPHVIDEHIESLIRDQFGNDRAAFIRTLAAQGYTMERFRQQQEEDIIVQAMRGQQAKASILIPEPKIREFYQQNIEAYSSEEQVKLRMIVLRRGANDSTSRRTMMQEIREKITAGAPFEDLARMYSEVNQDQGGDWGWISRKTLNDSLTKIAFSLKPGRMSEIMELENSYYLLFCEARKPGVTKPFAEVHDEIEKKLAMNERQRQQQEWIDKLRKKAYIKIY